jgi:hypothetical protein
MVVAIEYGAVVDTVQTHVVGRYRVFPQVMSHRHQRLLQPRNRPLCRFRHHQVTPQYPGQHRHPRALSFGSPPAKSPLAIRERRIDT